jgi:NADPH-dependent curcumin reductase CurA
MNSVNHQIRLANRPSGPLARSNWEMTTEPVPAPGPGEFVVAISYLSIDPAMRRWIAADYREPVAVGSVTRLARGARIVLSGGVSQYDTQKAPRTPCPSCSPARTSRKLVLTVP